MTYQLVVIVGGVSPSPVNQNEKVGTELTAVLTALPQAVMKEIKKNEGWEPLGGICFAPYGDSFLAAQAIRTDQNVQVGPPIP